MKTSNAQVKSRTRNTQHVLRITHYVSRFTLLAILLLTFSLRLYRLDAQSFWNDEGNSARLSERSIDLILKGTASDIHPPGYYLLLHFWRMPFGHSEFALRALSAFAGLMLVVFTYLLGCRLFGRTTGLVAAFLGAISPFAITYSQEARMYALLGALAASSTYSLVRVLEKAKEKRQGARGKRQEVRSKNAASCLLPPASCLLPPASCLLPPASCLLPPASCPLPPASCILFPAS